MTAISDFVAHPRTFLRNNALRVLFQMPANATNIRQFKFELKNYTATKLADNTQVPCYLLVPVMGQELTILQRNGPSLNRDYLNAYWCPYDPGTMHAITVDNGADFMFTTNMDGCSFGVGCQAVGGARRVAHINLAGMPNSHNVQNATLGLQQLNRHLVNPDTYMQSPLAPGAIYGEIKLTTIGIRNTGTGHWSFWYQQYRLLGGQINQVTILDVIHA